MLSRSFLRTDYEVALNALKFKRYVQLLISSTHLEFSSFSHLFDLFLTSPVVFLSIDDVIECVLSLAKLIVLEKGVRSGKEQKEQRRRTIIVKEVLLYGISIWILDFTYNI